MKINEPVPEEAMKAQAMTLSLYFLAKIQPAVILVILVIIEITISQTIMLLSLKTSCVYSACLSRKHLTEKKKIHKMVE